MEFIFKLDLFAIGPFSCNNSQKCMPMLILSERILKTTLNLMNNQAAIGSEMTLVKEAAWVLECQPKNVSINDAQLLSNCTHSSFFDTRQ